MKRVEIELTGIIGEPPNTPAALVERIRGLTVGDRVDVLLHSPGGSAFDALGMYELLRATPATVQTTALGLAASGAAIVFLAGEVRRITPSGFLMVHDPIGLVQGTAQDHDEMRSLLERLAGTIASIVADRTGHTQDEALAWLRAETWFAAEESLDAGFAHSIERAAPAPTAKWDLSGVYAHAPAAYRAGVRPRLAVPAKEFRVAACAAEMLAAATGTPLVSGDPDAKFRAEYRRGGGASALFGVTEEQYIASRRIDEAGGDVSALIGAGARAKTGGKAIEGVPQPEPGWESWLTSELHRPVHIERVAGIIIE